MSKRGLFYMSKEDLETEVIALREQLAKSESESLGQRDRAVKAERERDALRERLAKTEGDKGRIARDLAELINGAAGLLGSGPIYPLACHDWLQATATRPPPIRVRP